MACILNIETSTDISSVCISENGVNIYDRIYEESYNHARYLAPAIKDALFFTKHQGLTIDAVAVSEGPGSYTGLRIGVSEAKGLCYGLDVPLIAIPTLELLCVPLLLHHDLEDNALLCPMIDARRMEVYNAYFNRALKTEKQTAAEIITSEKFNDVQPDRPIYYFGNGAQKCQEIITRDNATYIADIKPLATNMFPLAEKRFAYNQFEDVAYFEPLYLKDFIATKAKNPLTQIS